MSEVTGAEFPESFNLDKDKKRLGLIDYEVTPPTAPDAYGGWWISAYDMSRLESVRIADNEINAITTQRAEIALKTKVDEAKTKLEAISTAHQKSEEWTSDDLARAIRPTQTQLVYTSSGYAAYSSGRVWVRSYVRKDGTFVRGHSRSR